MCCDFLHRFKYDMPVFSKKKSSTIPGNQAMLSLVVSCIYLRDTRIIIVCDLIVFDFHMYKRNFPYSFWSFLPIFQTQASYIGDSAGRPGRRLVMPLWPKMFFLHNSQLWNIVSEPLLCDWKSWVCICT